MGILTIEGSVEQTPLFSILYTYGFDLEEKGELACSKSELVLFVDSMAYVR